jgi:hypothetical protein
MRLPSLALVGTVIAAPATAGPIPVTLPARPGAASPRPAVAGGIEPAGGGAVRTLALWYDVKPGGKEPGTKWLSELRSWWRKGGNSLALPANGVSGATRAPGTHAIPLPANLKPGAYVLTVEAARETGGRELVRVPFTAPADTGRAAGAHELGAVTLAAR